MEHRWSERLELCVTHHNESGEFVGTEVIINGVEEHESIKRFNKWWTEQAQLGLAKCLLREYVERSGRTVDPETVKLEPRSDVWEVHDQYADSAYYGGTKIHFKDQGGPCYLRLWWHPERSILYCSLYEVRDDGDHHVGFGFINYELLEVRVELNRPE